MGKPFEIVLQRVQGTGSLLSLERSLDQSICKSRIFGQDRAMAVGTESIFVPHTFGPVLSVISITFDDLPQRADTCSQKGAPAVNSAVTPDSRLAPERLHRGALPAASMAWASMAAVVVFPLVPVTRIVSIPSDVMARMSFLNHIASFPGSAVPPRFSPRRTRRDSLQAVTAAAICNASFPDIFCAFSS